MVYLLSVRCLNCNNVDEFPRMDYDSIPFCSQCASTSNLVPETPDLPAKPSDADDLAALFSRNLNLTPPNSWPGKEPATYSSINYSISQHYTHRAALPPSPPPVPEDPTELQLKCEQEFQRQQEQRREQEQREEAARVHELVNHLISSYPDGTSGLKEYEIAFANGAITLSQYTHAVHTYALRLESRGQPALPDDDVGMEEDVPAHEMLRRTQQEREKQRVDPVYRDAAWFNDYYGGLDSNASVYMGEMLDEESPCVVQSGPAGQRLRPFDY